MTVGCKKKRIQLVQAIIERDRPKGESSETIDEYFSGDQVENYEAKKGSFTVVTAGRHRRFRERRNEKIDVPSGGNSNLTEGTKEVGITSRQQDDLICRAIGFTLALDFQFKMNITT